MGHVADTDDSGDVRAPAAHVGRSDGADRASYDAAGNQQGKKQRCHITTVLLGTDAHVEFQPNQEKFTGNGLTDGGIKTQHWDLEQQLERAFMEWLNEANSLALVATNLESGLDVPRWV